jgi:hypothetical protein
MSTHFCHPSQVFPGANTPVALYTVPAGRGSLSSTLNVCNTDGAATTFTIRVKVSGAADADAQFLYHEEPIEPHETFEITRGLVLTDGDVIEVESANGFVAFQRFGTEEY